jgi:hypothetical protein
MVVLPGVEQKLQLQNPNQVVLVSFFLFFRPAIIITLAFCYWMWVRRLILSGPKDQGWGVVA